MLHPTDTPWATYANISLKRVNVCIPQMEGFLLGGGEFTKPSCFPKPRFFVVAAVFAPVSFPEDLGDAAPACVCHLCGAKGLLGAPGATGPERRSGRKSDPARPVISGVSQRGAKTKKHPPVWRLVEGIH